MARPKRTPEQREADLAEMTRMLRRGCTKTMIAKKLGVHNTQITYDWKIVVKQMREARNIDTEALVAIKLEEYAEVKREAWKAWERSKKDATKIVEVESDQPSDESGDGDTVLENEPSRQGKRTRTTEGRLPANEYLKTIIACIAAERELQGLNPAKEFKGQINVLHWDALAEALPQGETPDVIEGEIVKLIEHRAGVDTPPVTE